MEEGFVQVAFRACWGMIMLFIGLTLLATSLEFSLWAWISHYSWIWEWWRRTVSCPAFYSVCYPGEILARIDNLFVECVGISESDRYSRSCILLGWTSPVYLIADAECNITQIDLFSPASIDWRPHKLRSPDLARRCCRRSINKYESCTYHTDLGVRSSLLAYIIFSVLNPDAAISQHVSVIPWMLASCRSHLSNSVVYFCTIIPKKGSFCGPCIVWVLRRFH